MQNASHTSKNLEDSNHFTNQSKHESFNPKENNFQDEKEFTNTTPAHQENLFGNDSNVTLSDYSKTKKSHSETWSEESKQLNALLATLPTPPKNGWERRCLGEVAEIIAGQSPQSAFYNDKQEGLLFFQGKKDFGEKYLNNSHIYTSQITKESVKNDILMSVRAPVGDVNLNPYEKICIGRGLAAIRCENYKFLFLCIHNNKHLFIGNQGMAFEAITTSALRDTKIPLPPLESQERIVSVIEAIEAKITNIDSKLTSLENQKTQILNEALNGSKERERERRGEA